MHIKKDNGVSPVIGTILLISLSVVLVAIVSVAVMSGISSFSAVDTKIVGFTVVVNDNETATVTPVSGPDLPYLQSYTVYLDNGHIQSVPESDVLSGAIITDFDDNVTRINIAGNFTDGITALVFSGKVINKTVVYDPSGGGQYYIMGNNSGEGYTTPEDFVASLNAWSAGLNTTYDYGNGHSGTDIAYLNGNQLKLRGDIVIGREPITITPGLAGLVLNNGDEGLSEITFFRAPGYEGPLLVIQSQAQVDWNSGTILTLEGNGHGDAPLMVIEGDASFNVAKITLINNTNPNGNGGGIKNAGTLSVQASLIVANNKAKNGGGIYNEGTSFNITACEIYNNVASENGGGIYNAGSNPVDINNGAANVHDNSAVDGGGVYNAGTLTGGFPITNNIASGNGGGIYNAVGGTLTLGSSTALVYYNTANGDGGGIYNQGSITALNSASYNTALGNGGGVYNTGTYSVSSGTISDNTALNGGGLYNLGSATHNGYFTSNAVTQNGGGIYNAGIYTMNWGSFTSNTAENIGNKMYATEYSTNSIPSWLVSLTEVQGNPGYSYAD